MAVGIKLAPLQFFEPMYITVNTKPSQAVTKSVVIIYLVLGRKLLIVTVSPK
jgi:hypothetical protein